MRKSIIVQLFILLACFISCGKTETVKKEPIDYVNNRIGNISHLLVPTYPTAHLPNSMLRMIPTHNEFVTDRIEGFPLNYPSHRQGDVLLLMPYSGNFKDFNKNELYRYDQEVTSPYKYSVLLDDYSVYVNFAPASKSAIYSFTFEKGGNRVLVLKTRNEGNISVHENTMSGYEMYNGIKHFFYLEIDQKPSESGNLNDSKQALVYAQFPESVSQINVRYGISYINEEQAQKNLQKEITDYDLNALAGKARTIWNSTLDKIQIEGGTEDQKATFYTALYRSHERMINISEDGRYFSAYDGKVHSDSVDFWVDDWVWDTYLALHPLQILLNPKDQEEKLASYIRMYEQSGWIPTFPCVFGDAHCMNGNHAAGVFADAMNKDIPFNLEKAFEGMKHTVLTESMIPWYRGAKTELDDFYHQNGWFPALHPGDKETNPNVSSFEQRQAVAVTTAASFDDWSIALMAKKLSKEEDYKFFADRSNNYRKLFNKETGFFHPKDKDGNFIEPFDYTFSGGVGSRAYYDENNAWTYNWDLRHNIADLVDLFGGEQRLIDKLDHLFVEGLRMSKWQYYAVQPDATGNVGQFVMGNEPSFHIPYLYNYVRQPWKTQKRIRMLMESWFRNDLMGICGDEDGGGMSAFYVFSAMGFYPVSPGIPAYNIGSPLFDKTSIKLENGKVFTIIALNTSWSNKYIQSAKLNGKVYNKSWFTHNDIMNGGTLELTMGNRPNKEWATDSTSIPPSLGL